LWVATHQANASDGNHLYGMGQNAITSTTLNKLKSKGSCEWRKRKTCTTLVTFSYRLILHFFSLHQLEAPKTPLKPKPPKKKSRPIHLLRQWK